MKSLARRDRGARETPPLLASLAHLIVRRRRAVIGVWIVAHAFGAFSAGQVSKRWFESFSIPGYSAYEANQRTLQDLRHRRAGAARRGVPQLRRRDEGDRDRRMRSPRRRKVNPGSRVSSYWSTGSRAYVSKDGHTAFAEIYPPGTPASARRCTSRRCARKLKAATPAGVQASLTGRDAIYDASSGGGQGPSVLTEALIGGLGSLVILFFVFGTLPAVLMPIAIAVASILNTFTLVWILTYITNVSIIVQFLIALVGLGVAIDYALLMIFRFRDELREGEDVETALVETMTHAGRSVIVSGSTVAVGLLSMVILPLPFIRSIGIGGMLIPAVSVARRDHAAAGAARDARHADQQRAPAAEALRRQRPPRGRLVGPLGVARHAAAGARRRDRPRDRRRARLLRAAAESERGAGEGLPRQRRRDRRPRRRSPTRASRPA